MSTILRFRGVENPALRAEAAPGGKLLEVEVRGAYQVATAREAGAPAVPIEARPDDILELRLEGGLSWYVSVEQLCADQGVAAERGGGGEELVLPTRLLPGGGERGLVGALAIQAFRVLGIDPVEGAAQALARKIEDRLEPGPGLYSCPRPDELGDRVEPEGLKADRPLLVLLHGTGSNTAGSFGDLAGPGGGAAWSRLAARYGEGAILALEHRTLSASPVENAIELLDRLPAKAELHLLSHSRGGLVGELLCRARLQRRESADGSFADREPFDPLELGLFAGREKDRADLERLAALLTAKQPRVTRFVRVACPARGTTLASRRLDRYLSLLANAIGLVPGLKGNPAYELVTALVLALAKKRADPEELPGLEAMMPESPLVRLLNRSGVAAEADLTVIAGDLVGRGVFGRLKELATNLFYRENHDLVVNTSAMTGGVERLEAGRYFFAKGPEVSHFTYFGYDATVQRLLWGLTRVDGTSAGFQPIEPATARDLATRTYGVRRGVSRPTVFVLPGIMGSHLAVRQDGKLDRYWVDLDDLAVGKMEGLRIAAPNVEAEALIGRTYGDLVEFLAATHEVEPFPFDWRRSLREEAQRLAQAVARKLDDPARPPDRPLCLLAHSMGGLLARTLIALRPDLWRRITGGGGRLVMLGTPNGGSFAPVAVLLGQERAFRRLALVDFKHSRRELLEIVSRFPGLLEMLPAKEVEQDFFDPATWQGLHSLWSEDWVLPTAGDLDAAKAVRDLLDKSPVEPEHMAYVAGVADETPHALVARSSATGARRIELVTTQEGDGRVSWSTGGLPGVPTWYLEARHGDLPATRAAFPAFLDLLASGRTSRSPLATQPPARAARARAAAAREAEVDLFPDAAELEAAALGGSVRREREADAEPLRVAVAHGDLAFVTGALLVGHYQDDILVGAEARLDRQFQGRLSLRRRLGLYPGALGSSAVIFNPDPVGRPGAGLIVGLGSVGQLTPGHLQAGVARTLLDYAVAVAERQEAREEGSPSALGIRVLLIGTGDRALSIEDSVLALVEGALQAQAAIRGSVLKHQVRLEELTLVELYLDRAVQAAHALHWLAESARLAGQVRAEETVRPLDGGRRRVAFDESPGWWSRLRIRGEEDGSLRFTALTDRARAEELPLTIQPALVDPFVREAAASADRDPAVAATLFELLVPNGLKDRAPERRDLLLIVDDRSAAYPWELLHDRSQGEVEPVAVRAGLIRQLSTVFFRQQVREATGNDALVVGDPPTDFPALPGAREEALRVADFLGRQGLAVTPRIGSNAGSIVRALFERRYRVLHLAGHGVYEWLPEEESAGEAEEDRGPRRDSSATRAAKRRPITGMVIGKGAFLTADVVEQMRWVPELVFLNCCFLGRIEADRDELRRDRHRIAANLATQFIRMGARAVVAAGWAVVDEAAVGFAEELYRQLLAAGRPFGEAVQQARQQTYFRHPGTNTWGAYQCYGDPGWVLQRREAGRSEAPWAPVAKEELLSELENLAEAARTAKEDNLDLLRQHVRSCEETAEERGWVKLADVRAALGRAFGEVDDFERAVDHYEKSLAADKARMTVESLEQLANLRSRWVVALWRGKRVGAPEAPDPERLIERSLAELEALPRPLPHAAGEQEPSETRSVERLCLLASCYKRRSLVRQGSRRLEDLREATAYYGKAHEQTHCQARRSQEQEDPYPVINWLAGLVLLCHLGWKPRLPALDDLLDRAVQAAAARERYSPSFRDAVATYDTAVVRHLARGDLVQNLERITVGYCRAASFGSQREVRSVVEHLEWMAEMLATPVRRKTAAPVSTRALLRNALLDLSREISPPLSAR